MPFPVVINTINRGFMFEVILEYDISSRAPVVIKSAANINSFFMDKETW